MKKIILQILVVLFSAILISAQPEEQKPVLIDEWGKINLEEIMVRLDGLSVELGNNPNTKALIKIFGGNANYFSSPYLRGSLITAYLKNNRRLPPEKYSIEYCNVNKEELRTQLFTLPRSVQFPKCNENLETLTNTVLFESIYFYFPKFKFTPLENSVLENGPSEGEYSEISQNILKRLSNNSPASKVYIIAYLQTNFEENKGGEIIAEKQKHLDKKSLPKE